MWRGGGGKDNCYDSSDCCDVMMVVVVVLVMAVGKWCDDKRRGCGDSGSFDDNIDGLDDDGCVVMTVFVVMMVSLLR